MPKSLTIRSFLPQREIDICQRLRDVRLSQRMEQAEFAEQLGITRSRLSSYEYAKAPIRYGLGKEFCYRFNVNQRWFATGDKPARPYFDISPNLEFKIKPKTLFSAAFDNVLDAAMKEREQNLRKAVGDEAFYSGDYEAAMLDSFSLVGELPSRALAFYVEKLVLVWLRWLPEHLQIEYGRALLKANQDFQKKHADEIAKAKPPAQRRKTAMEKLREEYGENSLTDISLKGKTDSMKSEMQKLLSKVKVKASQPGGKSQLANELGVAPARVSEWLSGKKEPGGKYTLRLLKWVES